MAVPKVLVALNLGRQMTTGGCGACIDQVVVPTAPPRPSARDIDAVGNRVVNERWLPKHPKSQHWVCKHFMVYAKDALVNIAVCT